MLQLSHLRAKFNNQILCNPVAELNAHSNRLPQVNAYDLPTQNSTQEDDNLSETSRQPSVLPSTPPAPKEVVHTPELKNSLTTDTILFCTARNAVIGKDGPSAFAQPQEDITAEEDTRPFLFSKPVRKVEINGKLVPIRTLKNGLDVSFAWDPILPHEDLATPLFKEMSKRSSKKNNLCLRERIDMLYAFVTPPPYHSPFQVVSRWCEEA